MTTVEPPEDTLVRDVDGDIWEKWSLPDGRSGWVPLPSPTVDERSVLLPWDRLAPHADALMVPVELDPGEVTA